MKNICFCFILCFNVLNSGENDKFIDIDIPKSVFIVEQFKVLPNGYDAMPGEAEHRIKNILVCNGPPIENGILIADSEKINKKTNKNSFIYNVSLSKKDGVWIIFEYYNTSLRLCKKMPEYTNEIVIYCDNSIPGYAKFEKIQYR